VYMSQHAFTPVPSKFDLWVPYNRNYMTLTSRAPGAVLSRILRLRDEPEKFMAVGLWTDRDVAAQWTSSAEAALGAKPSIDQGLYDGFPMTWTRWELVDFAWGLEGRAALAAPGLFVQHVTRTVSPERIETRQTFNRAVMSLMARRPGFVSGETYRGHRNDRLLTIYTFKDEVCAAEDPPAELAMFLRAADATGFSPQAPAPVSLNCSVFESVWGPEADSVQQFLGAAA